MNFTEAFKAMKQGSGEEIDVLTWLRRHFCQHNSRKHWSRSADPYGGYVQRCTKCNKIDQ